ncbi:hypothetical protein JB92DRAFT_3121702 [Gautieria morchelliformis]|nr:hypothetical protein JB92DRAFT_3121702 [Gautieria morchelliformis]
MYSPTRHLLQIFLVAGTTLGCAPPHDARPHLNSRALHGAWYHPESHPVHSLFKRAVPTPGFPEWIAQYPAVYAPPMPESATPKSWLDALQAAEQAGQIPGIMVATQSGPNQNPSYGGQDPSGSGPAICSSTAQCRGPDDHWDAPDGHVGIGFDDGPSDGSAKLYQFLQEQNQTATHFMIGINILQNYALFNQAYSALNQDIAVHTWTHPYMTTMNNSQIVAQLGWTMQIIHDSTGGRVPRYWRPPYGDSDNRVRAIAKTVFGLTQIDWNRDSEDWQIASGGTTLPNVITSLNNWYTGPKSPGLIILEHELTDNTTGAFMATYTGIKGNSWTAVSTVQLFDGAYQNANQSDGPVLSMDVGGTVPTPTPTPTSTSTSTATSASATLATSTLATTSTGSTSPNNNKINANGTLRLRRGGVSTLLLLVGTLMSAVR